MTVNLGLQLSTAQSHFACVSSVFSVLNLSFLELSRPGLHARASSCRPHTQNLTLHVQEWNLKWWTQKKPCLPPSTPYYSSESEFRSGCSSQGIEKGGRDVFPFPSCTSNRTQIGTEGWTVSAGKSVLSPAPTPSKANLPEASTQHNMRPSSSQT